MEIIIEGNAFQWRVDSNLCNDKRADNICDGQGYYFNDTQRIYESALNKWGKENQTRMMFEEMAELQKELCKEARGEDNKDAIAEEIADVKIMLEQMTILHNCKDMVEMQMKRKLQRLKERLEGE